MRKGHAACNFSLIRKITLAMLRLDTTYPKSGLRQRRNRASRKPLYRDGLFGLRPSTHPSPRTETMMDMLAIAVGQTLYQDLSA